MSYSQLTLDELIEQLLAIKSQNSHIPDIGSMPILCSSDYGDYCHTEQTLHLREIACGYTKKSAYSTSGLSIVEDRHIEGWNDPDPDNPSSPSDFNDFDTFAEDNNFKKAIILRTVDSDIPVWD